MKNGLIVDKFGNKSYYLNDKRHREDGPAFEAYNGSKEWFINGKRHREGDLPAAEYCGGDKYYYLNDELHREDGPAAIWSNGRQFHYLNGNFYSKKDFYREIERKKSLNYILSNISGYKKATFYFSHCLARPNEIHEVFQNSSGDWGVRGGLEPLRMADKVVTEDGIVIKDRYPFGA